MSEICANQLQKRLILEFWSNFGGKKCRGDGYPKELKLEKLREWAEIAIPYQKQASLEERREQFNEIKSVMHKLWITKNDCCFVCLGRPDGRHHIIQLQNGGINSKKNVVSICDCCHSEIHPWLKR